MNENVLMENPLDVFRDFAEIPDEAFIYDADEIKGLVRTLTNSEDLIDYLAEVAVNNPTKFQEETKTLKTMKSLAEKGNFKPEKTELMLAYTNDMLDTINQIRHLGGAFKHVSIPIYRCHPDAILPKYATMGDAGMDVYTIEDVVIEPNETKILKTGLKVAIPGGYYIMCAAKSGLSSKTKMRLSNGVGTIDSGYRGEIGVIVDNIGNEPIHFTKGSKIMQFILKKIPHISWNELTEEEWNKLTDTERGEGGFGSTGA